MSDRSDSVTRASLNRIPQPDYKGHPAYGQQFGTPEKGTRRRALAAWRKGFRVTWKQFRGLVRAKAMRCASRCKGLLRGRPVPAFSHPRLSELKREGILSWTISEPDLAPLLTLLQPARQDLEHQRSERLAERVQVGGTRRKFMDSEKAFSEIENPEIFAAVRDIVRKLNLEELINGYMGYKTRLVYVVLQINDESDIYWKGAFEDVGISAPATGYMHVDSEIGTFKGIIYLDEVDANNGPFCYVPGSPKWMRMWDRVIRKTSDQSGLDGRDVGTRELFWALPSFLQRKASFGFDLDDRSEAAQTLLALEHRYTSAEGNMVTFDGDRGIHRGAMIAKGERRILQLQFR